MNESFIGIDLCFAKRKFLPISICTWNNGRLIPEALRQLPIRPPRGSGNAATLDQDQVQKFTEQVAVYILARLRRFNPISSYFRRVPCAKPLFVLAPDAQNRL